MELEEIPRVWEMGVKALKMQRSLQKPQHPPQRREPAGQGGQWLEPGWHGYPLITSSPGRRTPSTPHLPGSHRDDAPTSWSRATLASQPVSPTEVLTETSKQQLLVFMKL